MRKPSIFSKDYNRKMKMRRIKIVIVVVSIFILGFVALYKTQIYSLGIALKENMAFLFENSNNTQVGNGDKNNIEEDKDKSDSKELNKIDDEEKEIEIKFSNGRMGKAIIINELGKQLFNDIEVDSNYGYGEISPDKQNIIISDFISQEIIMYKTDGSSENISKTQYTTRKGKSFSRESVLQNNNGFLWCTNPKFIDDNHIAYVSNLPYIGNGELEMYIWIINLDTKEHKIMWDLKGKNITFGELTDKGLQVNIDGKNIYMNQSSLV